jgi:hypothetical protein
MLNLKILALGVCQFVLPLNVSQSRFLLQYCSRALAILICEHFDFWGYPDPNRDVQCGTEEGFIYIALCCVDESKF